MIRKLFCLFITAVMLVCTTFTSAGATQVLSAPLVQAENSRSGMVRVLMSSMNYPTKLNITIKGSYTAEGDARVVLSSGDRVTVTFNQSNGNIRLTAGSITYDMGREMNLRRHQTNGQSGLSIAQARIPDNLYPGDLQLKAQQTGGTYRMYPVMHVYIEYYLHGVVPYEMGNSAPLEALKAQAVAARTYTLNKMNVRANAIYDVVDTTNDQVYYGNSDTTARCTEAVNATKGIVLMNGNSLTGTYYTASNGGQTESAANLWGSSGYGYLSVKEDPFDRMNAASAYRKVNVYADNRSSAQSAALKNLLQAKVESVLGTFGYSSAGASVLSINSITPHTPKYAAPSRLYTKMDFGVTAATQYGELDMTLTFNIFTELEGALGMSINTAQNELWSVEKNGGNFVIYAKRFGHGIGMSQRGAMQMGSMGYTYDQILGFYYENCRRVQYTFTHTILSSMENGGSDTIVTTEKPADITQSSGITAIVRLAGVSDRLAVRAAASENGKILTGIVNGGLVNVLARLNDWTMIQLGSIVGYVPTSALKFNGTPPDATDATPTQISQWATVNCTGTLNLRQTGNMNSGVIAAIPAGSVLCVFAVQNGWANVQYGANTGWCSTDFLQLSSSYPGQVTDNTTGIAAVTIPSGSGTVNLRETPSTSARVLATLSNGTQVTVSSSDGSWCSVTASNGIRGYVMAEFITYGGLVSDQPTGDSPSTGPDLENGELEAIVHTVSTSLNLRQQASTDSTVLASLPRGESVVVTQRGASWSAVRYGSLHGYVMTQYLRFPQDEESGELAIGYAVVSTASGSLNLRKLPSLGSGVLMQIGRGQRVSILQELDGWHKIAYAGINGYVMSRYLAMENGGSQENSAMNAVVRTPSGYLNLRQSPALTAPVLAALQPGTSVKVLTQGAEWSKIQHGNHTGYVMTTYLELQTTGGDASADGGIVQVHTGNGGLNLRETASASARVMMIIPDGSRLECMQYGAEWTKVRYGENTGYVMTRYLKTDNTGNQDQTQQAASAVVSTGGGGLNLRQTASTQALVLISIPDGSGVTLLERGDEWCRIRYQQLEGYVMTRYLDLDQHGAESASSGSARTGWITRSVTGGVNLRFMPDLTGQVLAVLAPGTEITVTLEGETWSVVRVGNQAGYVMSRYIEFGSGSNDNTTTPVYDHTLYSISGWEAVVLPGEGNVNLRAWCSTDAPVRLAIPKGAVVRLSEYGDTWCHVFYGEVEGYCMTQYLSLRQMD